MTCLATSARLRSLRGELGLGYRIDQTDSRCLVAPLSWRSFLFSLGLSLKASAAEVYPTRPITIVVPFAAGGPTDTLARLLAGPMSRTLGVNVLVEDVTGAAGTVGVGRVAHAAPDGYTISLGHWSTHVVNGAIYKLLLRSAP